MNNPLGYTYGISNRLDYIEISGGEKYNRFS